MSAKNPAGTTNATPPPRSRVWLLVVALCGLQIAAWVGWLVLAAHNRVAEVPLVTQGTK